MGKKKGSIGSFRAELLVKSKEAALCAIKIYNDPLVQFKSESYIVLMMIAWTYLLHSYYRSRKIDYRYFEQKADRKKYDRTTHGAYKFWELERCLNDASCPIDGDTQKNLRFLIALRHEIEHQMSVGLDVYLSGRYQACALNYNEYLGRLFGTRERLDRHLNFSLQFQELDLEQLAEHAGKNQIPPSKLVTFVNEFDKTLTEAEFNSPKYAYRLLFTRKLVNKPGQADKVVEFVDAKSPAAQGIAKEYWVVKHEEKKKYRPHEVVEAVQKAGFNKFRVQREHLDMWKTEDAKNPAKGLGADVAGTWLWYQAWVDRCIQLCKEAGEKYR
jgi:hypothetical protein